MDIGRFLSREHAGDVVAKEQMIERIWEGVFVTEEVLTNAIWQIRKALGDDARGPSYIKTDPRKGYRLIATCLPASEPSSPPFRSLAGASDEAREILDELKQLREKT